MRRWLDVADRPAGLRLIAVAILASALSPPGTAGASEAPASAASSTAASSTSAGPGSAAIPATTPDACGDADASGATTVTDGVSVLRTAAGLPSGCDVASRCDVDGDGTIGVADGVRTLRIAAELPATRACRHVVRDLSAASVFVFTRGQAFGFCPPLDSVSHAILTRQGDDARLRASVIVAGTPGSSQCLTDTTTVPPVECPIEVELPERRLTAAELARVEDVFAHVTIEQQRNPNCRVIAFDPCLLDAFTWDTFAISDFVCGEPRLLEDQARAITDLLDELRTP